MSTPIPTTSPAPTSPTGTSNPVPLRGWLIAISDWIRGLSPTGATAYDTGWLPVTPTGESVPGFSDGQVRRVGRIVYLRGRLRKNGPAYASGTLNIGELPSAISGSWDTASTARTVTGNTPTGIPVAVQAWIQGRTVAIYQPTAAVETVFLTGLSGIPVD